MAQKRKRKKQRRRGTSPHPGVVLRSRRWASGKVTWFARWTDPYTDVQHDTNLNKLDLTTAEARKAWAISKSKSIAAERAAVSAGRAPERDVPRAVAAAIEAYLERAEDDLRPDTLRTRRPALAFLATWCATAGVHELRQLTPQHLARFRDWLRKRPRRDGVEGKLSPATINKRLAHVKAYLAEARRHGELPHIATAADIGECLKLVRQDHPRPDYLRPAQLRAVLEASLRHDAQRFAMTRAEKTGLADVGSTPRYRPIAPFVLAAMLSGCRSGELAQLRWSDVLLDGQGGGELVIPAAASKTRRERSVDLRVSPALAALLAALLLRAEDDQYVFGGDGPLARHDFENARKRLMRRYGAPAFSWQRLRQTAASYLASAPSIFGAATVYLSASQLGHSVAVTERNYARRVRVSAEASTLEAAYQIVPQADDVIAAVGAPEPRECVA